MQVIKTQDQHERALQRLLMLMDENPMEGSHEADEIELLALLIESYSIVPKRIYLSPRNAYTLYNLD